MEKETSSLTSSRNRAAFSKMLRHVSLSTLVCVDVQYLLFFQDEAGAPTYVMDNVDGSLREDVPNQAEFLGFSSAVSVPYHNGLPDGRHDYVPGT